MSFSASLDRGLITHLNGTGTLSDGSIGYLAIYRREKALPYHRRSILVCWFDWGTILVYRDRNVEYGEKRGYCQPGESIGGVSSRAISTCTDCESDGVEWLIIDGQPTFYRYRIWYRKDHGFQYSACRPGARIVRAQRPGDWYRHPVYVASQRKGISLGKYRHTGSCNNALDSNVNKVKRTIKQKHTKDWRLQKNL